MIHFEHIRIRDNLSKNLLPGMICRWKWNNSLFICEYCDLPSLSEFHRVEVHQRRSQKHRQLCNMYVYILIYFIYRNYCAEMNWILTKYSYLWSSCRVNLAARLVLKSSIRVRVFCKLSWARLRCGFFPVCIAASDNCVDGGITR